MTTARNNYLAWQAAIGTEDVVLSAPWVRPDPGPAPRNSASVAAPSAVRAAPPQAHTTREFHNPAATMPPAVAVDAGFFQTIAETLAKPVSNSPSRKKTTSSDSALSPSVRAPSLPPLDDLDAYWRYLEAEYPVWFPGVSLPLLRAEGHPAPALAVVELVPQSGGVFAGEAGVLLDRMMKAIGLSRERMYLTSVMKAPPPQAGSHSTQPKQWARKDIARMLPAFFREFQLAQCERVLLLGEACTQAVLRTGRGLEALAGTAEETPDAAGISFTATWHPADLLRDEALKRPAWAHLQWLRTRLPAAQPGAAR